MLCTTEKKNTKLQKETWNITLDRKMTIWHNCHLRKKCRSTAILEKKIHNIFQKNYPNIFENWFSFQGVWPWIADKPDISSSYDN